MNTMSYKGYSAQIMEAERLTGEIALGLPPGRPLDIYPVESFNSSPENWVKKGAFVVPVKSNKGLWFNFRMNDESNTAVLMTIKGCNPITGLPTSGFYLDRYMDKCPKHGCDFVSNRFCPECGYKWPDRSYLSMSPLWWDGWMSEGAVRQFFFTEEMMRDVATHMIGKENTVPAFGFAFYSTKHPRPKVVEQYIYHQHYVKTPVYLNNHIYSTGGLNDVKGGQSGLGTLRSAKKYKTSTEAIQKDVSFSCSAAPSEPSGVNIESLMDMNCERSYNPSQNDVVLDSFSMETEVRESYTPQKEVAVGAGVKIRQELPVDTGNLDIWKDKPDSVMTVYFVFQEEFNRMAAGGFKDFKDCKDGMLNGLPVG